MNTYRHKSTKVNVTRKEKAFSEMFRCHRTGRWGSSCKTQGLDTEYGGPVVEVAKALTGPQYQRRAGRSALFGY